MKRTQLWKLLRTLDKKDIRELRKFVASPFFNQREDVIQLFELLANHLKDNRIEISKEIVSEQLFPDEPFDPKKIHLISSLLNGHCEQYLIWKERAPDEVNAKITLAKAYRKLKLDKPFLDSMEEAKMLHEKQPLRNAEYHEIQYNLLLEEFEYLSQTKRLDEFNLQDILNHLDKSFVSKLLRLECAILSHQAVAKKEYESGVFDINHISEKLAAPSVTIYQYGYQAIKNNDEKAFTTFIDFLKNDVIFFPLHEQKDIFLMAINFCIKKFNAGDENYAAIALEVYKEGIDKKVLIENNTISRFTFANIVRFAAIIKDWDWAEQFITDYSLKLESSYRESITSFSLGRISYERKNYGEAIDYLQKAEGNDMLINLSIKILLIKIYYEISEFKLLDSHLNAMKTYLHRQKNIGYHKESYENLIRFSHKLINVNLSKLQDIQKLRKEIEEEKAIGEKKWLLAQLDALKNKQS